MSNITPTNQPPALVPITERPAYLQETDNRLDQLTVGGGIPRISLNNNVISLVIDGSIVHTFGHEAQACILGAMPGVGRVYYAKQYAAGQTNLPSCWSKDGVAAAPDVNACPSPNGRCADCPMNVKGSAANGQGKACQYVKALAVLFPQDPNPGTVYRLLAKGGTIFGEDYPQQQLFNLKNLGNYLKTHGIPIGPTVFRMVIDLQSPTPSKLLFQPIGYVDQAFYEKVIQPIPDEQIQQITELDFAAFGDAEDEPASQAAPAQLQAIPAQPQVAQPVPQTAAPAQPAAPVQPAAPQAQPAAAQTTPVQQPVQPTPVQPTPVQPAAQEAPAQAEQQVPVQPQQNEQQNGGVTPEDIAEALKQFQVNL